MLTRSFLIESSSKLLVTRTGIKAWTSLILGRIRLLTLELLALEWRKFHTFELEYLWSQLANLDQILCVASLGWGKGCISFWGRLTLAHWTRVSHRCPLGYLLVGPFVYFRTSCVWTVKPSLFLRPSPSSCGYVQTRHWLLIFNNTRLQPCSGHTRMLIFYLWVFCVLCWESFASPHHLYLTLLKISEIIFCSKSLYLDDKETICLNGEIPRNPLKFLKT